MKLMKLFKVTIFVLGGLTVASIVTLLGIAYITFSSDGAHAPGAEWLVGLGYGALWGAFVFPALAALLAIVALLKRRFSAQTT